MASRPVVAEVRLWGDQVGAVAELPTGQIAFEYGTAFVGRGLQISPRHLPADPDRRDQTFTFPALRGVEAFQGLPGVLADALPDRFGNAAITQYFAKRGTPDAALSPVQRLLYIGHRAMGALEFEPPIDLPMSPAAEQALEVAALVAAARQIVSGETAVAVPEIMQLSASAGGARAKAVILWNRETNEVRSGFAPPGPADEPWIIKFDGVGELTHPDPTPQPFNRVEYAYNQMATTAGITTSEVALLPDRRLAHFLSRRFDRESGQAGPLRLHLHSLGGMEHVDYNTPGAYSYEQWFRLLLDLRLSPAVLEEAFRRAVFNLVAVNQDDHVKNIGFLMRPSGEWELAPAYDLTFARGHGYTRQHQMTFNGKVDGFRRADILNVGAGYGIKADGAAILDVVLDAVGSWPTQARAAGVPAARIAEIEAMHRDTALAR